MPARRVLPLILFLLALPLVGSASASDTPAPSSVTIAGSLQSELGCSGDWLADCATTHLAYDASDDKWQGTFTVPAGSYEYKAAAQQRVGRELRRERAAERREHRADRARREREVLLRPRDPLGDFEPELGHRDGARQLPVRARLSRGLVARLPPLVASGSRRGRHYSFSTQSIPAGSYEAKVAIDEAWNENYGAGGVRDGANIAFTVRRVGDRDVPLRLDDSRALDHVDLARAVARQRRVVRRPWARQPRHALPGARRRRAAGDAERPRPLPDVPRRRHRRDASHLERGRAVDRDAARRERRAVRSRVRLRLLAGDRRHVEARARSTTASSSATGRAPSTTRTTATFATAAGVERPTTRPTGAGR